MKYFIMIDEPLGDINLSNQKPSDLFFVSVKKGGSTYINFIGVHFVRMPFFVLLTTPH